MNQLPAEVRVNLNHVRFYNQGANSFNGVLVGTHFKALLSRDLGLTWTPVNFPRRYYDDAIVSEEHIYYHTSQDSKTIFASSRTRVFKSQDGGLTWTDFGEAMHNTSARYNQWRGLSLAGEYSSSLLLLVASSDSQSLFLCRGCCLVSSAYCRLYVHQDRQCSALCGVDPIPQQCTLPF